MYSPDVQKFSLLLLPTSLPCARWNASSRCYQSPSACCGRAVASPSSSARPKGPAQRCCCRILFGMNQLRSRNPIGASFCSATRARRNLPRKTESGSSTGGRRCVVFALSSSREVLLMDKVGKGTGAFGRNGAEPVPRHEVLLPRLRLFPECPRLSGTCRHKKCSTWNTLACVAGPTFSESESVMVFNGQHSVFTSPAWDSFNI